MKRLVIICEGQTELEFCKDVLVPVFSAKEIFIQTPLIKKSGGGIVPWPILKRQIERHLHEPGTIVTTFFDYYGIPANYDFPKWIESLQIQDKAERMDFLEKEMWEGIQPSLRHRFIPYIQLHEFEGLLFNNIEVFENNFSRNEILNHQELLSTIESYPNPEMINDTVENAPSKRLLRLISGYDKVLYGSMLAESIGLGRIREKSLRFNIWIEKIISI